ncbi:MAG: ABC transporter permease subunit [Rhizobiaceae bacterium]|nr:MAG: ABC transporter permease subunit [Rhizobiaceae bacterium]
MLSISIVDRAGNFTLQFYESVYASRVIGQVLVNTFQIAASATLLTVVCAYPVAYYLAAGPQTLRSLLLVIVLVPFWTSVLVRAFAWMLILGRNGVVNSGLQWAGVIAAPLDLLYSFFSTMVGMVHALMPIAILTMVSAMQNIDRNLDSAASTLGARRGNVFWRIYFPLSFPGVASGTMITFIASLGIFVQPALLGGPREMMVGQLIIEQIDQMNNWGLAAAIAVSMLLVSVVVIVLFERILGIGRFDGIGQSRATAGTGRRSTLRASTGRAISAGLGWATDVLLGAGRFLFRRKAADPRSGPGTSTKIATFAIVFFLVAPALFLIPASFTATRFLEWPPQGFSLQWYEAYLSSPVWQQATIRSIVIGFTTACISVLFGVPAAFALTRFQFRLKGMALPYIMLPIIAPNIIVALSMFYFFADIGLVGTSLGLIIGHSVLAIPYVVVTMLATLQNYDQRLDEAAWTLGARRLSAFRLVTLPLIKVGFITSFVFAFVRSFDELTVALFISSGLSTTLPKQMWSEAYLNVGPTLAAVSTILIIFVALIIVAIEAIRNYGMSSLKTKR